ncbi:MAG: RNA polymerase sigma factor [bacterium]|jgi:RNA polymerase sigma-70 factor (ECF subfamily)
MAAEVVPSDHSDPSGPPPDPASDDGHASDASPDDRPLLDRIAQGDQTAWGPLLERHQDRLFAMCLRLVGSRGAGREVAADLLHDSLVKIIQGIDSFDGSAKFSTWATRVVMNTCLSHLRAQKHRQHASLDDTSPSSGGSQSGNMSPITIDSARAAAPSGASLSREPATVSGVQSTEEARRLALALDALDVEQRTILVLRDVRELEYEQIAHLLGVPEGTVKSRLFRARAALREMIERLPARLPDDADP